MVCTPRHRKSSSRIAVAIVIVCIVIAVVGWHDGLFGTTSIADINHGDVSDGTPVTIKGILALRIGNLHTVTSMDGDYAVAFEWTGTSPAIDSVVVVRGVVDTAFTLNGVSSVEAVWVLR